MRMTAKIIVFAAQLGACFLLPLPPGDALVDLRLEQGGGNFNGNGNSGSFNGNGNTDNFNGNGAGFSGNDQLKQWLNEQGQRWLPCQSTQGADGR
jgi:hypothetical protein